MSTSSIVVRPEELDDDKPKAITVRPEELDQDSVAQPAQSPPVNRGAWEKRADGSAKGDGYLGVFKRPDGKVSSEISVSTDEFGGKEFPTLVPTLSQDEVSQLLNLDVQKAKVPPAIVQKASEYARQRQAKGLPLFAQPGEQNLGIYPQFARANVPQGAPQMQQVLDTERANMAAQKPAVDREAGEGSAWDEFKDNLTHRVLPGAILGPAAPIVTGDLGRMTNREARQAAPVLNAPPVVKGLEAGQKVNEAIVAPHNALEQGLELQKQRNLVEEPLEQKINDAVPGLRAVSQFQKNTGVDALKFANDLISDPKNWPLLLAGGESAVVKALTPIFGAQMAYSAGEKALSGDYAGASKDLGMALLAGHGTLNEAVPAERLEQPTAEASPVEPKVTPATGAPITVRPEELDPPDANVRGLAKQVGEKEGPTAVILPDEKVPKLGRYAKVLEVDGQRVVYDSRRISEEALKAKFQAGEQADVLHPEQGKNYPKAAPAEPADSPQEAPGEALPNKGESEPTTAPLASGEPVVPQEPALEAKPELGGADDLREARVQPAGRVPDDVLVPGQGDHGQVVAAGSASDHGAPEVVPGNSDTDVTELKKKYGIGADVPAAVEGFRRLASNDADLEKQYDALGSPNYVAADKVKELVPGWEDKHARAEIDPAVHKDASSAAYRLFQSKLAKLPADSDVLLVTGPVAAGKTSGSGETSADLTYEVNLSDYAKAKEHIDNILAHGDNPEVRYVYNTPEGSVIRRARRMMNDGRPVDISRSTAQHIELPESIEKLARDYGDKLKLEIVDNSGKKPIVVPIEDIDRLKYTRGEDELLRTQQAELDRLQEQGAIPDRVHAALSRRAVEGDHAADAGELGEGGQGSRGAGPARTIQVRPEDLDPEPADESTSRYGDKNTLVTKEDYEASKTELAKKLGSLHAGVDPTALKEYAKIGAYHIEAGAREFAEWSKKMLDEFGDKIKPHLQSIYDAAKASLGEQRVAALEARSKVENSPEFKKFFGDSRVVDETGNPQIVYHGSNRRFSVFEPTESFRNGDYGVQNVKSPAFFFTPDRDAARTFAKDRALISERLKKESPGRPETRAFYLKADNPLELTITPEVHKAMMDDGYSQMYNRNALNPYASSELEYLLGYEPETWEDIQRELDDPKVIQKMKDAGYDGVHLREHSGQEAWAVFDPRQIKSATSNKGTFDSTNPSILRSGIDPTAIVDMYKQLDKEYDHVVNRVLEKTELGKPNPQIRQYDNEAADLKTRLDASGQFHKAVATKIAENVTGELITESPTKNLLDLQKTNAENRDRLKGFHFFADKENREWLKENRPADYQRWSNDPKIEAAVKAYKPYEEQLREAVKKLGGKTIDVDYIKRVMDFVTGGIDQPEAKTKAAGVGGRDSTVSPQVDRSKSRKDNGEFYWNHGVFDFGPSFEKRWVEVMSKLDEHQLAVHAMGKGVRLDSGDQLPASIHYNGQVFYRPDVAREIHEVAKNGKSAESKMLARSLGVEELVSPKEVHEYGIYEPFKGGRFESAATNLAKGVIGESEAAKGQAANLLKMRGTKYAVPKEIADTLNNVEPQQGRMSQVVGRILAPVTQLIRQQIVGFGYGVPHMGNVLRKVMQQMPGGAVNPKAWIEAGRVAFSKELHERGIDGVNDPAYKELLRNAGISEGAIPEYKHYVEANLNPATWGNAFREGGKAGNPVTAKSALAGLPRLAFEPLNRFSEAGHANLFKTGGIDQRARLWLYDRLKSADPGMKDADIAHAVNQAFGRYNRASWTDVQKGLAPFLMFPGWDMSSVTYAMQHPIKTSLPPAVLILLSNYALNSAGLNDDKDKNDPFRVHIGHYAVKSNLVSDNMGSHLTEFAYRAARAKMEGKSNSEAANEAARGAAHGLAGLTVNTLNPILSGVAEVGYNRKFGGSGKDIDTRKKKPYQAVKDYGAFVAGKALPTYERAQESDGSLKSKLMSAAPNLAGISITNTQKKRHGR